MVPTGQIDTRPRLHAMQKKNLLPLVGITPQFLSCWAHSLLLFYLGCPSSQHTSKITDLLLATSNNPNNLAILPFAGWLQLHPQVSTVLAKVPQFHYETYLKTFSCIQCGAGIFVENMLHFNLVHLLVFETRSCHSHTQLSKMNKCDLIFTSKLWTALCHHS